MVLGSGPYKGIGWNQSGYHSSAALYEYLHSERIRFDYRRVISLTIRPYLNLVHDS
jgi:hypothetical protein